jgi:hypothetical protein
MERSTFSEMPARSFRWFPVVVNVAQAIPYALTLIPASKRGSVDERGIDVIAKLNIEKTRAETEPCYAGLDPFSGEWRLFGPLAILILRFCNSDSVPKPRDHFRDVNTTGSGAGRRSPENAASAAN